MLEKAAKRKAWDREREYLRNLLSVCPFAMSSLASALSDLEKIDELWQTREGFDRY